MRIILILLFFSVAGMIKAQEYNNVTVSLGIGIVAIKNTYNVDDKVVFYSDAKLSAVPEEFYINKTHNNRYPKFYKPDYGICYFVCVEQTSKCFRILINETEERYIAKDSNTVFMTWKTVLEKSIAIKRINNTTYFYDQPTTESHNEQIDTNHIIKVLRVNNDWIEIIDEKTKKTAWLKWRENNKLTIDILFLE